MDTHDSSSDSDSPAGRHEPIWTDTSSGTDYGPLEHGLRVDTAVVGGGITGVKTAAKLAADGQTVALVERDRILQGVTAHTTAKVTSLHGLVYDHLLDNFDPERARQYADANEAAIETIADTVERRGIDCEFRRTPPTRTSARAMSKTTSTTRSRPRGDSVSRPHTSRRRTSPST